MMVVHLNNYFDFHVCLSIRVCVCLFVRSFVRSFVCPKKNHFLKSNHKISLIKVTWCVSSVKNMYPGSSSDPSWPTAEQGKAKLRILNFKTTWSEFQKGSQTTTEQGKAEQCIFDFKATWSEFQKPSQTATERGKAELRILDFKTT